MDASNLTPEVVASLVALAKSKQLSDQQVQAFNTGSTNFAINLGEKTAIIEQLILEETEKTKNLKAQTACELVLKNYVLYVDTALQQENTYCKDKRKVSL